MNSKTKGGTSKVLVAKKKLEYYDPEQVDMEYEKQKKIRENQKRENRRAQSIQKLFFIGFAIIGLALSLYILQGYASITKVSQEITELENQKLELKREKEDLIGELEAIKSPIKIEEDALIKLGMDYPKEEQIVYMDVKDLDFTNNKDSFNIASETSVLERFKSAFNLLLGLF